MASSDVKLVPGQVMVAAWDLCVDSPDRRKSTTPYRRALVHDFDDGLTLNWAGDYPGGVSINGGRVRVNGKLEISPATFQAQATAAPATGSVSATRGPAGLGVTGSVGTTQAVAEGAMLTAYLGSGPVDVMSALAKLFVEVDSLKKKVAKLEAG